MKKLTLSVVVAFITILTACAQTQTTNDAPPIPITNEPAYQLFPTQNMWTFIKLDTRTGVMWQVQYSTKGDDYRFETYLSSMSLIQSEEEAINGRFTLYPTQNTYNFILLDQIDGRTWQVQWSMDAENRVVLPIR